MGWGEWVTELEQWRAGRVRHIVLHLTVVDGELGFVGEGEDVWAITHIRDGAVTPLVVGTPEAVYERRPRSWNGRAHVPVPAVILGGERITFAPVWGRAVLGVAQCPHGQVALLGIVGDDVGVVVLAPEPVLVFAGRPQEFGTINLDRLEVTRRSSSPTRSTARSSTSRSARAPSSPAPPASSSSPATVTQAFERVRAMVRAPVTSKWSQATLAEIPNVVNALERWTREGRGVLHGRRSNLYKSVVGIAEVPFSEQGFAAALCALAEVGIVTPASRAARLWRIDLGPDSLGRLAAASGSEPRPSSVVTPPVGVVSAPPSGGGASMGPVDEEEGAGALAEDEVLRDPVAELASLFRFPLPREP